MARTAPITTAGPEPIDNVQNPLDREHYVAKQVKPVAEPVLATLRLDGYTDLRLKASRTSGSCTTIPIGRSAAQLLLVNAECGKGRITVELLDAVTDRVLSGYAAADCVPLTDDGAAQVVKWKNSSGLEAVQGDFRILFYMERQGGGPKIHSFFFQ